MYAGGCWHLPVYQTPAFTEPLPRQRKYLCKVQVNQLLVGVHSVAACEAMLLAEKLGIQDRQALQEVLHTSFGCSEVLKRHMPVISARCE